MANWAHWLVGAALGLAMAQPSAARPIGLTYKRTHQFASTIHTVVINPHHIDVRVATSNGNKFARTSIIARQHKASAAINGSFFSPRTAEPIGLVVVNKHLLSRPFDHRTAFVIGAQGHPLITNMFNIAATNSYPIYAVGGGPLLVENGRKNITSSKENFKSYITNGKAPRTAIGYTKAGTIIWIVADGRTKYSKGVTLSELATLCIQRGASFAINMDGGGSSTMFYGGRVVNHPSEGGERPVHNVLIAVPRH